MSRVLEHKRSTVETRIDDDARLARDESRLGMIAYWLVKYTSFLKRDTKQEHFDEKFSEMVNSLETDDAKQVARAWKNSSNSSAIPDENRFKDVADRIYGWAKKVSAVPS